LLTLAAMAASPRTSTTCGASLLHTEERLKYGVLPDKLVCHKLYLVLRLIMEVRLKNQRFFNRKFGAKTLSASAQTRRLRERHSG
ncbi:MAG: hypothetical protein K2N98_03515, partial [Lachnospiraceae bacterium]|nr:hypothetical protein [Lachnospiraceae bacterium]